MLAQRKLRFRSLVRPSSNRSLIEGSGAWLIEGDLTRPKTLKQPMEGVKHVIHLAGVVRSREPSLYREVNAEGTRNLLHAAAEAGVERVVLLSSDTAGRAVRDAYADSKAEAEAEAAQSTERGGPACVVLRAPMILGQGSRHLRVLEQLARLPAVPVPKHSARRRPVWVGDVCHALLRALEIKPERLPAVPIALGGSEALSVGELIQAVARARNLRAPRLVSIPLGGLRAVAGLIEQLGFNAPLSKDSVSSLSQDAPYDPQAAREFLDWEPHPLHETIARCVSDNG